MNQDMFIKFISENSNIDKSTCEKVFKSMISVTQDSLKNHKNITLPGICKLEVVFKEEKSGYNPRTREKITIPAKYSVKASVIKTFQEKVKNSEHSLNLLKKK